MAGQLATATVVYSIAAVALLGWALATAGPAPAPGPLRAVAALIPGGLTTVGLLWGAAFALTSIAALTRGAGKRTLLVTLVAFVLTWALLELWTQLAARSSGGAISPNELWLYAGSRWFFLGAGVLVVAAAAIRWPPRGA
ncbi:MAG TPA: hypothetical protein VFW12_09120 [Candidatus Limnocylindria bacterium]|nr:hypothetical protein [Candidatus Limnocylindria bacterium]